MKFQFTDVQNLDVIPTTNGGLQVGHKNDKLDYVDATLTSEEIEQETFSKTICRAIVKDEQGREAIAFFSVAINDSGWPVFTLTTKTTKGETKRTAIANWRD